jgi:hypothetical protein
MKPQRTVILSEQTNDPTLTLVPRSMVLKSMVGMTLVLGAALPALLVDIPAMLDYPNLLARMYLRVNSGTPSENPFYQMNGALYPNLAMDILVPPIARFAGVELTTKLFYVLSNLLLVTGSMAIEYRVKGKVMVSIFTSMMFLYCLPFTWGFLNFQFGLGLALWGIVAWLSFENRQWLLRALVHSIVVFALFLAHFFALGIYGASIGLYELWRFFAKRSGLEVTLVTFFTMTAPVIIVLSLMVAVGGPIPIGWTFTGWSWDGKLLAFWNLISGYNLALSSTSIVLLWLLLIIDKRHLSITAVGVWILLGFTGLFLVMPSWLFGVAFVDVRVLAAGGFIVPAFISVTSKQAARRLALLVSVIAFTNAAHVSYVWLSYRDSYSSMKSSFALLEKESLVLVGSSRGSLMDLMEAPIYHGPTLAVHYADALVSSLFLVPGVDLRPEFRHLDGRQTVHGVPPPIPIELLEAVARNRLPNAPHFLRNWQLEFDYVYLVGAHIPNPMSDLLEEIAARERFTLYRVKKSSEGSGRS